MDVIIVSGRSGSGKSTALHLLEDEGYFCIDNLPASLMPQLIRELAQNAKAPISRVAVCIDARNTGGDLTRFSELCSEIKGMAKLRIVFLDAQDNILIRRFSETRRKHPLSNSATGLAEAIHRESQMLEPIASTADLTVDTSNLNVHSLRALIRSRLVDSLSGGFSLMMESFAYKMGVPVDADYVFDVRMLPNPHWEESLRRLNGRDSGVIDFLNEAQDVDEMYKDILGFLQRWLPRMRNSGRAYVTVAVGCTGGQHRSVYMAERLSAALTPDYPGVQTRHRELAELAS